MITEFLIPEQSSAVAAITAGPDGNLWVSLGNVGKIERVTPSGTITEFSIPGATVPGYNYGTAIFVTHLATGPDGAVWFTAESSPGPTIGRVAPDGQMTEFHLPEVGADPIGIANELGQIVAGSDGNLWFTRGDDQIGRITPSGNVTFFPVPSSAANEPGIAEGPDGAVWFTEQSKVGRITTDGTTTEFPAPTSGGPITLGPDGALWFTDPNGKVGRITTDGQVTEFSIPSGITINQLTAGPDGALWFTDPKRNAIGRIGTDGTITEFPLKSVPDSGFGSGNLPWGIAAGPDGNIWFTEEGSNNVARLILKDGLYVSGGPPLSSAPGTAATGPLATIVDTRPGAGLSDFTATIDWGDGQTSAGSITAQPGGAFLVSGTNTYATPGTYPISITVNDVRTGEVSTVGASSDIVSPPVPIIVSPPPVSLTPPIPIDSPTPVDPGVGNGAEISTGDSWTIVPVDDPQPVAPVVSPVPPGPGNIKVITILVTYISTPTTAPLGPTDATTPLPSAQSTGALLAAGPIAPTAATVSSVHTSGPEILSTTGHGVSNLFETRVLARFHKKNAKPGPVAHATHMLVIHPRFESATGTKHHR